MKIVSTVVSKVDDVVATIAGQDIKFGSGTLEFIAADANREVLFISPGLALVADRE